MSTVPPLSRPEYEAFIYQLMDFFPSIRFSSLAVVPPKLDIGHLSGIVAFGNDIVLCVNEWLDFSKRLIVRYSYEISKAPFSFDDQFPPNAKAYCLIGYEYKTVLYWYDSWPHPNEPSLASTHPHHKHVHPNIKRNRIPAIHMSFVRPNLPALIAEIEQDLL